MVNKSIANQLNVQILVLVLKSLQKSHPDLKFVSKFASIKCQSKLKMSGSQFAQLVRAGC